MKLASENIISNPNELAAFGRAFGAAQPHFNFIDVGAGKERADHKVRETLRLYLPNAQCRHVFFGPCHDKGYLPALEPYRGAYASKITLVETVPAETGFAQLGLQRISIPQAFRDKNLPPRYPATGSSFQASGGGARLPSNARIPSMDPTTTAISPPPTSTSPAPSTSSQAPSASSWATIGKGTTGKSFDLSSRPAPKKRYLLLNAYDERLDPDLPKADGRSWERFTDLTHAKGRNFCNNHHLGDKCESGEYCEYLHGPKLTNGELLVLKNKARSIYCSNKSYCRDIDCYLGHHCKFGNTCSTSKCRFGDTHNVDLEPARRYYEDGSEEWLPQFLEKHTKG